MASDCAQAAGRNKHGQLWLASTGTGPSAVTHRERADPSFAGANVKAIQKLLGHASAAMTLDIYASLFSDDLDRVAERLDAAHRDQIGTKPAQIIGIERAMGL